MGEIKHIILDVDGIVLGSQPDINFPFPSSKVLKAIKRLSQQGMPISLCTGKPTFALKILLEKIPLPDLHISDGGAVISNPVSNKLFKKSIIAPEILIEILNIPLAFKESWQVYTFEKKFVLEGKFNPSTMEDSRLMPWMAVRDLHLIASESEVTKLELIYPPEFEHKLAQNLQPYSEQISLQWTHIPNLLPNKILIITTQGFNKRSSVLELLKHYRHDPAEVLAIGDTIMDWQFMEACGSVATLANASEELQQLVKSRAGKIGRDVNNDGLVDILKDL